MLTSNFIAKLGYQGLILDLEYDDYALIVPLESLDNGDLPLGDFTLALVGDFKWLFYGSLVEIRWDGIGWYIEGRKK